MSIYPDGSLGSYDDGVVGKLEGGGTSEHGQPVPGELQADDHRFIHSWNSRHPTRFNASVKTLLELFFFFFKEKD